jgi:hypothetical protein
MSFDFDDHTNTLSGFSVDGFNVDVRMDDYTFYVFQLPDHYEQSQYFWALPDWADEGTNDPGELVGVKFSQAIRSVWNTAVEITNAELGKGNWNIMARVGGPTSAFSLITPDIWCHFEITDWARGIAESATGERLYSVHLAPADDLQRVTDAECFAALTPDVHLVVPPFQRNRSLHSLRSARTNQGAMSPKASNPVDDAGETPVKVSSAAQEKACFRELLDQMRARPHDPIAKNDAWIKASGDLKGLSRKGFDRAWAKAITETGSSAWQRPGRRRPK